MEKVELRRKRIINIVYLAIVLGLAYLFLKYCFGLFFPFIFAFFIAIIVQKPSNYLAKKTKLKNSVWSAILVIILYLLIIFLISLLGVKVVDEVKSFIDLVRNKISDLPTLIDNIKEWVVNTASFLPDAIEEKFVTSATEWFDKIREQSVTEIASSIVSSAGSGEGFSISSIATPISGIISTFKFVPSVFIGIFIAIISSCFMAIDYDRIVNFIKNQIKGENREKLSKSKKIIFRSLGGIIRSYATIILITGIEIFVGLNILKLIGVYEGTNIILVSLAIAVLDILPVIGTGTFVIPWAIYSFITGKIGLGIGLLIIYVVIYIVRQIIEPKLVGGTVGLPAFVTLMAMYIGTQLFGFIGLFLLPMIVICIKLLNDEDVIHIWKPSEDEKEEIENSQKSEKVALKKLFAKKSGNTNKK